MPGEGPDNPDVPRPARFAIPLVRCGVARGGEDCLSKVPQLDLVLRRGKWISNTDNSADELAWRYVVKVKVQGGFGQPYGEASIPLYVLGPVEKCREMVAKAVKVPDDRGATCDGPFYFKRW